MSICVFVCECVCVCVFGCLPLDHCPPLTSSESIFFFLVGWLVCFCLQTSTFKALSLKFFRRIFFTWTISDTFVCYAFAACALVLNRNAWLCVYESTSCRGSVVSIK